MTIHKPVLLKESIAGLNLKKDSVVVDATLGGGGHASEILKIITRGKLVAIDQDSQAIEDFEKQSPSEAVNLAKGNFSELKNILGGMNVLSVSGILADLGYSSIQLKDESYGMSFLQDAPLDMRLNKENELTAKKIVNEYEEPELEKIIKEFGEEKFSKNIAKKIIEQRKRKSIETTVELAKIIESAVPGKYKHGKLNPATKTFQALRIAVNQEIENLEKFLPQAIEILESGGRLAIITFHSLEDRTVNNIFRENARGCICPADFPECRCTHEAKIKIITKKPIVPSAEEVAQNPRSRSAKLRIAEKI